MVEAGFPAGVFSLVQGGQAAVEALCDHPGVGALAFVGSSPVAQAVYSRATAHGKRCLALGGAKNILILAPDADPDIAVEGVVSSFTGCAGQRCMAASVMVAVGNVDPIVDRIILRASSMKLGQDMGALIDRQAIERLSLAVQAAAQSGAKIRLDGRNCRIPEGYESGNWFGPTILDQVAPSSECATRELFGPVLSVVRAKTLEEALSLEHESPYGNAISVFTQSGAVARRVAERAESGMIGINIGVPVPREPFSFGGTKRSRFGHGDITGRGGVEFWSYLKKITSKWSLESDRNWMS
jgi:malonate-semialdehyde dehydrogenase (acetylating)/methylmalonate-semialdehyde dehydrogenase